MIIVNIDFGQRIRFGIMQGMGLPYYFTIKNRTILYSLKQVQLLRQYAFVCCVKFIRIKCILVDSCATSSLIKIHFKMILAKC